jgi:DNA-binding MarR family transcriptional regulator
VGSILPVATRITKPARPAVAPPLESPRRRRLPILLRRAWYGLNQAFRRRIAHTGVTPDQFTAMRTLWEGPAQGMTQRDLTSEMSSDPNTVASLVERLVEAGWVERKRHETDGRAYRIRLTSSGLERMETVRALALDLQGDVITCLPESERVLFLAQLEAVSERCKKAADDAARAAEADDGTANGLDGKV